MVRLAAILGRFAIQQLLALIRIPLPIRSRRISSANYNGETIRLWVAGRGPYEYAATPDEVAAFLLSRSQMTYAAHHWLNR